MSLRFYAFYIAIIFKWNYVKALSLETEMIKAYVGKQAPVHVIFYTCWEKQQANSLFEELLKSGIVISVTTNFSKILDAKQKQHPLIIISDANCTQFENLLEMADDFNLFRPPYRWLILNNINYSVPSTTKILLNSNFVLATLNSDNEYDLTLIYKYTKNDTDFVFNNLGKFSSNKFTYYNQFLIALNRTDLMGSPLTTSYVLSHPEPYIDLTDYRNHHINGVSKLSLVLTSYMLEILNCTKRFIQRPTWGYKSQNATYYTNGMYGDLQNGTAEIAGTVGFYTISRMEIIDYVNAATPSDMKFVLKAPPLSYVQNLFTLPFDVTIWYGLYVVTAFTIVILYIVVVCESKYKQSLKKANNIESIQPKFFDVVLLQFGAITQQGTEAEPKSLAGRTAVFIVFLVLMFLYTAYSASIVALLQSSSRDIRTIHDLLNSKIELGVEDIVYSRFYFENQQESVRKAIYKKKIAPSGQKAHYYSIADGIKRVRNEFFGFHCETTSCYKEIRDTFEEHEKCGLLLVDYLNLQWPSLSVRKHSPYFEIVKVAYRKLYEMGIRHRQMTRIYYQKPQCTEHGGTFTSVGLIDAYFPLVLFCIGASLSLWILVIEILFNKYHLCCLRWIQSLKIRSLKIHCMWNKPEEKRMFSG